MSDGTLIRVKLKFERDYTQIPNEWLRDPKLSLRARGLLALLMSHKEGYTVTHKSLVATNPEGSTAMQAAVDELKRERYLVVNKVRGHGGRVAGWTWELTDPAEEKRRSTPELDIPGLDSPDLEKPDTDNGHLKEAQPQELITQVLKTSPSTRAGVNEEPLTRHDHRVAAPSPEQRYEALIHQPCPFRKQGAEHAFHTGHCSWCGISSSQRWVNGEPVYLADLDYSPTSMEVQHA